MSEHEMRCNESNQPDPRHPPERVPVFLFGLKYIYSHTPAALVVQFFIIHITGLGNLI